MCVVVCVGVCVVVCVGVVPRESDRIGCEGGGLRHGTIYERRGMGYDCHKRYFWDSCSF